MILLPCQSVEHLVEALLAEGQIAMLVLVKERPLDDRLHVAIAQNVRRVAILAEV